MALEFRGDLCARNSSVCFGMYLSEGSVAVNNWYAATYLDTGFGVICMGYCIVLSKFVEHHVYGDM
jgi:hypothetical protein